MSTENQEKKIRWGFIGCGNVTEVKSGPAYFQTKGFKVEAVMARTEENVKDYAERHGIKTYYTNSDELINNPEIDAVYIATPPDSHKEYALKVAKAGKICCIEKPLAPDYKDSLEIYEAFAGNNLPLFVAYYRRSLPRFEKIKSIIDSGKIGEVRHINWKLCRPPNEFDLEGKKNWRTEAKVAPGGYFDDIGSHGLDLFAWLLGDFIEVYGISDNQQKLYSAKDALTACWKHSSGATGAGFWNFGASVNEEIVEVYGSKGKIEFSVFDEVPITLKINNKIEKLEIEHPKHIQKFHVENIWKDLISDYEHPSTGKTGLHISWVMDKILGVI